MDCYGVPTVLNIRETDRQTRDRERQTGRASVGKSNITVCARACALGNAIYKSWFIYETAYIHLDMLILGSLKDKAALGKC